MSKEVFKRIGVGWGLGFCTGLIMALPFFQGKGELLQPQLVVAVWERINSPALWLADWWTYKAGLPPQSEAAWVVTPAIMILVQWTLLGILAGVCWALKTLKKCGPAGW